MRSCKAAGCGKRFAGCGFVVWCSPECGLAIAEMRLARKRKKEEAARKSKDRADTKARKAKLKKRSEYIEDVKIQFNKWVRLRDYGKTCISCESILGDTLLGGAYDAGHYRSVGSAKHLRFDERNVHGQCKKCNRWGSGMAVDYRRGLVNRIGLAEVEALEADQAPRKYTIDDLIELKRIYSERVKQLEKNR